MKILEQLKEALDLVGTQQENLGRSVDRLTHVNQLLRIRCAKLERENRDLRAQLDAARRGTGCDRCQ